MVCNPFPRVSGFSALCAPCRARLMWRWKWKRYREINPLVASNPLSWIVGIRSYGILFVVVWPFQNSAAGFTVYHKPQRYHLRPHQYLSQGFQPLWFCYKDLRKCDGSDSITTTLWSETKPRCQTPILSYQWRTWIGLWTWHKLTYRQKLMLKLQSLRS